MVEKMEQSIQCLWTKWNRWCTEYGGQSITDSGTDESGHNGINSVQSMVDRDKMDQTVYSICGQNRIDSVQNMLEKVENIVQH